MSDPVAFALEGDIAVITTNSPPVNALGHAVRQGLVDAIRMAQASQAAKSILIWCEGRTLKRNVRGQKKCDIQALFIPIRRLPIKPSIRRSRFVSIINNGFQ